MIIYNVTITVEATVLNEWLNWMKRYHIPDVLDSGFFISATISRVLSNLENEHTYAIAYTCKNIKELQKYQRNLASKLQKKYIKKYGKKTVAFRTILESIETFNYCRKGL